VTVALFRRYSPSEKISRDSFGQPGTREVGLTTLELGVDCDEDCVACPPSRGIVGPPANALNCNLLSKDSTRLRFTRRVLVGLFSLHSVACGGTATIEPASAGSGSSSGGSTSTSGSGGSTSGSGGSTSGSGGSTSSSGGSTSSSGGSTADPQGSCGLTGGPTAADFASRIATSFCDTLAPCCATAGLPFDRGACQKYIGSDFKGELSRVGSGLAFDCAAGQRCLDEIASAIQGCSAFDKAQLAACNHLTVGTLPVGAPCSDWKTCAAPLDTFADCQQSASGSGNCTLEPGSARGKLGEACGASCDPYGQYTIDSADPPPIVACFRSDGLYCSAGHCAPIAPLGGACTSDVGCTPGVLCLDSSGQFQSSNDPVPGQCVIPAPNGRLATPYICLGMPDPSQN